MRTIANIAFLLIIIAALLFWKGIRDMKQADQDFYSCYTPIYRLELDQDWRSPRDGKRNPDTRQQIADRKTSICMQNLGYELLDPGPSYCADNLLPICFAKPSVLRSIVKIIRM